jgi:hypothetical protein
MRDLIESDNSFICENIFWVEVLMRDRIMKYWLAADKHNKDTTHIYCVETVGFTEGDGYEYVNVYFSVEGTDIDTGKKGIIHFVLSTVQESIELGVFRIRENMEDNYNTSLDRITKIDFYGKGEEANSPRFTTHFGHDIVIQPSLVISKWGLDFFSGRLLEELLCYHLYEEKHNLEQLIYCLNRLK